MFLLLSRIIKRPIPTILFLPVYPSKVFLIISYLMEQKLVLKLLLVLLGFSYVLSLDAIPLSRILKSDEVMEQGFMEQGYEGVRLEEEGLIYRRMDVESNDYPGTGANGHHDPKTPGRS